MNSWIFPGGQNAKYDLSIPNIQVQIILLEVERYGWKDISPIIDGFSLFCLMCSSQQKTIINAMAVNEEGVMVTGGMETNLDYQESSLWNKFN